MLSKEDPRGTRQRPGAAASRQPGLAGPGTLRGEQAYFDFVHEGVAAAAETLLDRYLGEARARSRQLFRQFAPGMLPGGRRLLASDRHLQAAALFVALSRVLPGADRTGCAPAFLALALGRLVSRIARRRLPLRPEQAEALAVLLTDEAPRLAYAIPVLGLLRVMRRHLDARRPTEALAARLGALQRSWRHDWYFNPLGLIQRRIAGLLEAAGVRPQHDGRFRCRHAVVGENS
jgi:hypothetical protein